MSEVTRRLSRQQTFRISLRSRRLFAGVPRSRTFALP